MNIPRNNYFDEDGQITFVACINWIPGLIAEEIDSLPSPPVEELSDLFGDYHPNQRHFQRKYEWRELLVALYPNWTDWSSGFEGLGSLFGSEENGT
jgi:hypothetical protein